MRVEGGPDFEALLNEIRSSPAYRNQIVHWRRDDAREADFADTIEPLSSSCQRFLERAGIARLYSHQAEAVDAVREGNDVLVVTGTASGKSLCYQLPMLEMLELDPAGKALLLHPTKALSQDQFQAIQRAIAAAFPPVLDVEGPRSEVRREPPPAPPSQGGEKGDLTPTLSHKEREKGNLTPTLSHEEREKGNLTPTLSYEEREKGDLIPTLSREEREERDLAPTLSHEEREKGDLIPTLSYDERGKVGLLAGVFDGDTPANMRRKLRDEGSIILTNPDMLHAGLLPQHTRWAEFLQNLRIVVVDELHTYGGLFGSNAANLFRRFERVCAHYGSHPLYIFCSATIGNPGELARKLTGREPVVIDRDGSPRGAKTFVFWNPPRIRQRRFRSRRSANVEATELMAELVRSGVPTITFSKAKITAELIYRYVSELLQKVAPHLAGKVTSYRGGYLPEDRRDIERRLFSGELLGVSTTPALELGIDVGGLDASIMVGYPGTLAGFFQQAGRAGRRERESLAILVGIDTSVNQYVMKHPEYLFGRPIERLVLDPDNPHVLAGQLRCAAYELPICESEVALFGQYARLVLDVLVEQKKLNKVADKWYHASDDVPEHEVSLRDICDKNVAIIDVDTNRVIGELNKYDAQPIIHPEAIYIHQGETYIVLDLDLDRMHCYVKKIETDYYTQPLGGTDVHHIDQPLRERDFGTAKAYFGEVTSYFRNSEYEKIRFYTLDAISRHPLNMPTWQLQTMAFWITPPEDLVREMIEEGLDVHKALMGIGYAVRMILPLFIQCETLDFSHSSCTAVNAPWHTVFIYERYPHGLGFTEQAFEILADVILATLERIETCDCADGCPCCVGKPLRSFTTWNIERGEASIPSKRAALRLLRGIIGDGTNLRNRDEASLGQDEEERRLLMERGIRRRLEKMGDPEVFHPIDPNPEVGFPEVEKPARSSDADIARRALKRMRLEKREPGRVDDGSLHPLHQWGPFHHPPDYITTEPGKGIDPRDGTPAGISRSGVGPVPADAGAPDDSSRIAKDADGRQYADLEHERVQPGDRGQQKALRNLARNSKAPTRHESPPPAPEPDPSPADPPTISLGDSIAAKARKLTKRPSQER